jgi:hypothetical protein
MEPTVSMGSESHTGSSFEIDKVDAKWLITALLVVPFAIYFLLNLLSPLVNKITAMSISEVRSTMPLAASY